MARDRWTRGIGIGALMIVPVLVGTGRARAEVRARPDELKAGKFIYERSCVNCHGPQGAGDGVAASQLDPQPRDFTRGVFKFRSTPNGTMPTLADLERTATYGITGTAMNQWSELSAADRRAVLLYIETFSRFGWQEGTPITVPPEPPFTMESAKRGAQAYQGLQCMKCHGATGRGDGPSAADLKDSWDRPIRSADLTVGSRFKRGSTPRDIYVTFFTGLMGTPMPSYAGTLKTPEEEWDLVHFVYALSQGKRVP